MAVSEETHLRGGWQSIDDSHLNVSPNALGWAELQHIRNDMGKEDFLVWMDSPEFSEMIEHDLAMDYLDGASQQSRKFRYINPESLQDFIRHGGVDRIRPWHLRLMLRLDRVSQKAVDEYNAIIKSGVLDKKSVRDLQSLNALQIREMPLSHSFNAINGDLDQIVFMRRQIMELERLTAKSAASDEEIGQLQELYKQHEEALEPWRLVYGASIERLIAARDVQARLQRLHNQIPSDVSSQILSNYRLVDSVSLDFLLRDIEAMDDVWMASPRQVERITDRFREALLELRGEAVDPKKRPGIYESYLAHLAAQEAMKPDQEVDTRTIHDIRAEEDAERREARWGWIKKWVPGL